MSDFSPAMQSAAIYLYEKKGKTLEEICTKFSITPEELNEWLHDRERIKTELKDQLTKHYISAMQY